MKLIRLSFLLLLIFFTKLNSQNLPEEYWKLSTKELSKYSDTNAQLELASRNLTGSNGDIIDIKKAQGILNKPEISYLPAAIFYLYVTDINNRISKTDFKRSFKILKITADKGNPCYQYITAICYRDGIGIEKDFMNYLHYLNLSSVKNYSLSLFSLGFEHIKGNIVEKNISKTVELFTKSANQGFSRAQYNLGVLYENDNGVEKNIAKAIELYTLSANQGYAPSQYNLAIHYENGESVEKNITKAIDLYTLSANQGYTPAQYNLAILYANGNYINKNISKAVELYTLSAIQGHTLAQNALGVCYEIGDGVEKNISKAIELYTLSAKQWTDPIKLE